jgi:hypothetical protein
LADGLDAYVPRILWNGGLYDPDVDRFFLDLPLNGVRSRHSLRAYGYDIAIWLRFLADARDKTVWAADREDVKAFHRTRRRGEAGSRISAASWNRSVAAMDKLYAWGVSEGLLSSGPFTHREVWRRNRARGCSQTLATDRLSGRPSRPRSRCSRVVGSHWTQEAIASCRSRHDKLEPPLPALRSRSEHSQAKQRVRGWRYCQSCLRGNSRDRDRGRWHGHAAFPRS